MHSPLTPAHVPTQAQIEIDRLYAELDRLRKGRITKATETGYAHDWRNWSRFCERIGRQPFPATPETLSLYITDLLHQGKKLTTVCRYAAGVAYYHVAHGAETPLTPAVHAIISGARQILSQQPSQVQPISVAQLRAIAATLKDDGNAVAVRNLSILTLGFASALRRSNLSWLELGDVEFCGEQGIRIHIRREKNDRNRQGRFVGVPPGQDQATCPVRSLEAWLRVRGREYGALYTRLDPARTGLLQPLSANAFSEIVKDAAQSVDPNGRYSSHSLRSGLITEAGIHQVSHLVIQRQSGHKSLDSLARYFRPVDVFAANAAGMIGL